MKRLATAILLFITASAVLSGCGETFQGVSKDANRMGKGVNTFFFREE